MGIIKCLAKWFLPEPDRASEKSENNLAAKPKSHNKTPYWQCQGCGAVQGKPEHLEAIDFFNNLGSQVLGGITCYECNTRHGVEDIATGKYDMLDPEDIVASAIADKENTVWDEVQKKWIHKGRVLNGSKNFGHPSPLQFDELRNKDGKLGAISIPITREKIINGDIDFVDEISVRIKQEVKKSGVIIPCLLHFSGYDDDPRPVWQIHEVRHWCAKVFEKAPYFPTLLSEQIADVFSWSILNIGKVINSGEGASLTEIDPKEWVEHLYTAGNACIKFLIDAGMDDDDVRDWIDAWSKERSDHIISKFNNGKSEYYQSSSETSNAKTKTTEKLMEDGSPEMELWNAVKDNNLNDARMALRNGSAPNPYKNDGTRALEQACLNCNLPMAQLLLNEGAKFDPSYIHAIVGGGPKWEDSTELLSYWIDKGADVNFIDQYHPVGGHAHMTPLHRAAFYGYIEKARVLISRGAKIDQPAYSGETALDVAVTSRSSKQLQFVQMLLKNGADPSNRRNDGSTPLHHAASYGNIEIIKSLLDCGADINAIASSYGASPLDLADLEENTEAIKFLEQSGACRVKKLRFED